MEAELWVKGLKFGAKRKLLRVESRPGLGVHSLREGGHVRHVGGGERLGALLEEGEGGRKGGMGICEACWWGRETWSTSRGGRGREGGRYGDM